MNRLRRLWHRAVWFCDGDGCPTHCPVAISNRILARERALEALGHLRRGEEVPSSPPPLWEAPVPPLGGVGVEPDAPGVVISAWPVPIRGVPTPPQAA